MNNNLHYKNRTQVWGKIKVLIDGFSNMSVLKIPNQINSL